MSKLKWTTVDDSFCLSEDDQTPRDAEENVSPYSIPISEIKLGLRSNHIIKLNLKRS